MNPNRKTDPHEQIQKQNRDAENFRADLRAVFTSPSGRNVLRLLAASAGCGRPSFLPAPGGGPCCPYAAAFRDGRKSIIDEIHANLAIPEDEGDPTPGVIV